MSSDEELAAWLRRTVGVELAAARLVIAPCDGDCARPCEFHPAAAAEWHEMSSGVLNISEGLDRGDAWDGVWAMGDSRVTRFIAGNDPRSVIARCEAELAILDACSPDSSMEAALEIGDISTEQYVTEVAAGARIVRLLASGYKHRRGYREEWKP